MRRLAYSNYLLPARPGGGPRKQPYMSTTKLTSEQAAARGAIAIVPGTTEMREEPETEEEKRRAMFAYPSAGREKPSAR